MNVRFKVRVVGACVALAAVQGCSSYVPLKKQDPRYAVTLDWKSRTICQEGNKVWTCVESKDGWK